MITLKKDMKAWWVMMKCLLKKKILIYSFCTHFTHNTSVLIAEFSLGLMKTVSVLRMESHSVTWFL